MAANLKNEDWDGIAKWLISCRHKPDKWINEAYPWGVKHSELEHKKPRKWQIEQALQIREQLEQAPHQPIQQARGSGHGIGKSAQVSMLAQWALMTHEDTRGIVTANTDTQLRTKTWPEMAKWYALLPPEMRELFKLEATALHVRDPKVEREKAWRIDAHPWSEHNTEAFAGLHNQGKRIVVFYDEASAIADKVFEVTEGALTDEGTEIIWAMYGNATRPQGKFVEALTGARKHRWTSACIDSRDVEGTNKVQIQKWIADYGEDSDFVRVRVRGLPPRSSSLQYIEGDLVTEAMSREVFSGLREPLIMGIDVARGGDDEFVIAYRRGLDARTVPWVFIPGAESRNTERTVSKVVHLATTDDPMRRPDAVVVDETGIGGPIVDRLRNLLGDNFQVLGVQFGGSSPDPQLADMRMYMYKKIRDGLRVGLALPNDPILERQLTAAEATHDKNDKVRLESKEDIKDRLPGIGSPDRADALGVTYAYNVQPRESTNILGQAPKCKTDYDPLERD